MTKKYVVLLRGINVGGKNKLSMAGLKTLLEDAGYQNVRTFIASGNVILESDQSAEEVTDFIEASLPRAFALDSSLIKVLTIPARTYKAIMQEAPKDFGSQPDTYHSDVIFLISISSDEAIKVFDPRDGIDKVWQGQHAIYSQRLSAQRTKSRLGKIIGTPAYQQMTIRSWNTATKLLAMLAD